MDMERLRLGAGEYGEAVLSPSVPLRWHIIEISGLSSRFHSATGI